MGTKANLLAGVGTLYIAPTGESLPELDDLTPPAITISTPAGNWEAAPFTIEDHDLDVEFEHENVMVNEHDGPVKVIKVREGGAFKFKFSERDLAAYNKAISSGTLSTVAAGADQVAQDILGIGDTAATEKSLLYVGISPEGGSRVLHVPICTPVSNLNIGWRKGHKPFDVEFRLQSDPSQSAGERLLKIYDITAVASS